MTDELRDLVLHRGTRMHRVHRTHRTPVQFNPDASERTRRGGRFDATPDDPYPYYYAALTPEAAAFEVLLNEQARAVREPEVHRAAKGRTISEVQLTANVRLVALLRPEDFAAAGQGEWLVRNGAEDYPRTRRWARAARVRAPWAQGLIWRSAGDGRSCSVVLFGDRVAASVLRPLEGGSHRLDEEPQVRWLSDLLGPRVPGPGPVSAGRD
ncbi:RES domain-containing protein [Kitasatospora cineracea]|uniref:RES domain-containing protein n=1 Tax=Kitasatospora cineracea TaxID=88074 RepID=UPI00381B3D44